MWLLSNHPASLGQCAGSLGGLGVATRHCGRDLEQGLGPGAGSSVLVWLAPRGICPVAMSGIGITGRIDFRLLAGLVLEDSARPQATGPGSPGQREDPSER